THLGNAPRAIFVGEQVKHLAVIDLPGHLARLTKHFLPVFGVGVIAEIRAFIDEAVAGRVDDDTESIAVALVLRRYGHVAEIFGVTFPGRGVTARPMAIGLCSCLQGHRQPIAGVVPTAAHLREIPAWPEIAGAPLRIALETAAGKDDGSRVDPAHLVVDLDDDAGGAADVVMDQLPHPGLIEDMNTLGLSRSVKRIDQPRTAVCDHEGRAAPELEAAVHPVGLTAEIGHEADAVLLQPEQDIPA